MNKLLMAVLTSAAMFATPAQAVTMDEVITLTKLGIGPEWRRRRRRRRER